MTYCHDHRPCGVGVRGGVLTTYFVDGQMSYPVQMLRPVKQSKKKDTNFNIGEVHSFISKDPTHLVE